MADANDIARRIEEALTGAGTRPDLISVMKPTITVWHNFDVDPPAQVDAAMLAPHLEGGPSVIRRAVADYRDEATDTGAAGNTIYHTRTMCCLMPDATWFRVPQCWIFRLEDGLIARIELYADKAQMDRITPLSIAVMEADRAA